MKVIRLTESDLEKIVRKVLTEQKTYGTLKLGDRNDDVKKLQNSLMNLGLLKLKSGQPTTYYGPLTRDAVKKFQRQERLTPTGEYDQTTRNILSMKSPLLVGNIKPGKQTSGILGLTDTAVTDSGDCVGLDKKQCAKISSTKAVPIPGKEQAECARYVTKCLSQYDSNWRGLGNAWNARSIRTNALNKGTEKYNMFSTANMDWKKIWNDIKSQGITKEYCQKYKASARSDEKNNIGKIQKIGRDNIPTKSGVNISSLEPGDIIGLWHGSTTSLGKAMCDRLVDDLGLDDKGNFKQLPFTYNTHVGFVTAIKDGVPIIAHNVSGNVEALPANQALYITDPNMITWVVSDPDVQSSLAKRGKQPSVLPYQTGNRNVSSRP